MDAWRAMEGGCDGALTTIRPSHTVVPGAWNFVWLGILY